MKGMFMSAIVFFVLISLLSVAYLFSTHTLQTRDMVSQSILANRIYYKFQSISDSVIEIIEEEMGGIVNLENLLSVIIDEQPDYSYVTFSERLPQEVGDLNEDLARYEEFVETFLPERNLDIDTGIAGLGGSMTSVVNPYNITYTHIQFGQRQLSVIPEDTEDSLGKLNSYNLTIQLIEGWKIDLENEAEWGWGPLKSGDLDVIVLITDENGGSWQTIQSISREQASALKIDTIKDDVLGWVRARFNYDSPGALTFEMHLSEAILSIGMNLTDVPGKTEIDLPDGKINVVEKLYNIEKNGTVLLD